jgi:hypothetical protein
MSDTSWMKLLAGNWYCRGCNDVSDGMFQTFEQDASGKIRIPGKVVFKGFKALRGLQEYPIGLPPFLASIIFGQLMGRGFRYGAFFLGRDNETTVNKASRRVVLNRQKVEVNLITVLSVD